MLRAPRPARLSSTDTRSGFISVGDLITAIYEAAMREFRDPELAMVATDATLTDILCRWDEEGRDDDEPSAREFVAQPAL
jgi:hypothetical protein